MQKRRAIGAPRADVSQYSHSSKSAQSETAAAFAVCAIVRGLFGLLRFWRALRMSLFGG